MAELRLAISAPYPEGAVTALSRHAPGLVTTFCPFAPQLWLAPVLLRLGQPDLARRISARDHVGPERRVSRLAEPSRLVSRAARQFGLRGQNTHAPRLFDRAVAKEDLSEFDAIIGLPGACLETFKRAREANTKTIFHAVNAHPLTHNQRLLEFYPRSVTGQELITDRQVKQIIEELELADLVLVPSRLVARQMVEAGVSSERIGVIPYATAKVKDREGDEEPSGTSPRGLCISQVSLRKGLPFLAAAMRDVDVDVDVVGVVVTKSVLAQFPSNLHYRGVVSRERVTSLLRGADFMVLPTIEDACALATFEAAAAGVPVITTAWNGAVESLDPECFELVVSGDVSSLRNALNRQVGLTVENRHRLRRAYHQSGSSPTDWEGYTKAVMAAIQSRL